MEILNFILVTGLLLVFIITITVNILRLFFVYKTPHDHNVHIDNEEPFVSIHIPCCNEPVDIVLKTINAALKQDYPNYEVLVICNNTPEIALWKPIQEYCNRQSSRVRFIYINNVKGFKAGALNYAINFIDEKTDFIFTVDADYILKINALSYAVKVMKAKNVDLVQFPQAYYNVSRQLLPLEQNFNHYFSWYLERANKSQTVLPTGTLSLIKLEALKEVGNWPIYSITEDALLGVLLQQHQKSTLFDPEIIGKGLMPTNYKDLKTQRTRWAFGNMQVLKGFIRRPDLSLHKSLAISLQLSAWINLCALPIVVILLSLTNLSGYEVISASNIILSILLIGIYIISKFIINLVSFRSLINAIETTLVDISLFEVGAFSWIPALFNYSKPFKRTNKFTDYRKEFPSLYLPVILIIVSVIFNIDQQYINGVTLLSIALLLLGSKIYIHLQMRPSRNQEALINYKILKKTAL